MNPSERLILQRTISTFHEMEKEHKAYDLGVLILVEYVKGGPERPTQDRRVLCVSAHGVSEKPWRAVGQNSRGMMVSLLRRSVKPILEMSNPSMRIRPSVGSTKRKNESAKVLFPDPVRPRTPTFSPGWISKERWCNTLGKSGCHIVFKLVPSGTSPEAKSKERERTA